MFKKQIYFTAAIGILLALSACGLENSATLFKPKTPSAVKQADLDACKIASFKSIPQAYTTNYSGGYYFPGNINCHKTNKGNVSCDTVGGAYAPPTSYTQDMNAPLRWRFVQACLRKKGYDILPNKPRCATAADRAKALNAKTPADLTCNPDTNLKY